ncbi:hypothetical protein HDU91_003360, partial [Kappamyces sp. JEL0680]
MLLSKQQWLQRIKQRIATYWVDISCSAEPSLNPLQLQFRGVLEGWLSILFKLMGGAFVSADVFGSKMFPELLKDIFRPTPIDMSFSKSFFQRDRAHIRDVLESSIDRTWQTRGQKCSNCYPLTLEFSGVDFAQWPHLQERLEVILVETEEDCNSLSDLSGHSVSILGLCPRTSVMPALSVKFPTTVVPKSTLASMEAYSILLTIARMTDTAILGQIASLSSSLSTIAIVPKAG